MRWHRSEPSVLGLPVLLHSTGRARARVQTHTDIPEKGVAVRDDSDQEDARVANAKQMARQAEDRARADAERARAEAERVTAAAVTGEGKREGLRQLGLIYSGLIGVAVLMVQPFLAAPSLDVTARISIIAFAVAIPLLAGLVMVNWQEGFRGRRSNSISLTVAQSIAQLAAVTGIVAGFWHVTWVAGVTFLVAGIVAIGVHSAGWWRVESPGAGAE
jgi:hypothetical protein